VSQKLTRVLLIEDNPGDARLLREMLADAGADSYELTRFTRLSGALEAVGSRVFDVAFLDLSLPDSSGIDTFYRTHEAAPNVPIIVLTGSDDATLAVEAVKAGAQDYLVKDQVGSHLLIRAMRYAIERHRFQQQVRDESLTDELSGLYNRRGFYAFAQQHLRLASRSKRGLAVVFLDLDGLKHINDTYGHAAGDQALVDVARILQETFRDSDIIARMGGDEFAVMVLDTEREQAEHLCARLESSLDRLNASRSRQYELSLSTGICHCQPAPPCCADELIARADQAMYEQKRRKKAGLAVVSRRP
jgi:diguanylate cyclase (GGDEF)-like protein